MKKKTTDIKLIKSAVERAKTHPQHEDFPYTWGRIIQVHTIGPYDVVEYFERKVNSEEIGDKRCFGPYVDGKECDVHAHTLEGALLIAMETSTHGFDSAVNRRAWFFAAKLLDVGL